MGFILGKMELDTKVFMKMVNDKAMEQRLIQMETNTMANGLKVRNMATDSIPLKIPEELKSVCIKMVWTSGKYSLKKRQMRLLQLFSRLKQWPRSWRRGRLVRKSSLKSLVNCRNKFKRSLMKHPISDFFIRCHQLPPN